MTDKQKKRRNTIFSYLHPGGRCTIFHKLCKVIELVEAIKKVSVNVNVNVKTCTLFDPRHDEFVSNAVRVGAVYVWQQPPLQTANGWIYVHSACQVEMFHILGPHPHPLAPIEVKFCTAKWTHMPVGRVKFLRESVQRLAPAGRKI